MLTLMSIILSILSIMVPRNCLECLAPPRLMVLSVVRRCAGVVDSVIMVEHKAWKILIK